MPSPAPLTNIYHGVAPTRLPFSPGPAPGIIPNATFTFNGAVNSTAAAAPDVRVPEARDIQLNASARNEPVAILLGRNRVGAKLGRPLNAAGGSLLFPLLWGDGEHGVDAIESITMGNKPLPANATVVHYDGTQTSPDGHLVSAMASVGVTWTSAMTGVAWTKVILPPLDPAGELIDIGDFHAVIRGWKAHDPRTASVFATPSTWLYTTNNALLIARLVTRYLLPSPDAAFWTSVTAAADRCDQIVSGTTKRFTLNYVILQNERVEDLVAKLARSAGLRVVPEGASFRFIIDQPGTSVGTINKSKWLDGSFSHAGKDVTERHNVVYVSYTEPNAAGTEWITRIAPRGADVPAVPASDVYRAVTLPGAWINSYQEALRYAQYEYGISYLQDMTCAWTETADAAQYTVGDIRSLTEGPFTNKLIRITKHALANFDALWRTEAEEYQPATYSDAFVTEPDYPDTTLPSAGTPPSVTAPITLTEEAVSVPSGALPLSKVRAFWTGVTYPFFQAYKVVITNSAGVVVDEGTTTSATYLSTALNAFSTYTVSVRVLSSVAQGSAVTGTITLVSLGIESLATVWSQAITGNPSGWYFYLTEQYKLWPGDTAMRIRTSASSEPLEATVYTGPTQATPGMPTQLLDIGFVSSSSYPVARTPIFDMGTSRAAVFALYGIARWVNTYSTTMYMVAEVSDSAIMTYPTNVGFGDRFLSAGRYVRFEFKPLRNSIGNEAGFFAVEFDPGGIAALMPTVTDTFSANSSASAGVTITLPRKYIVVTSIQITPLSITSAAASYSNLTLSETLDNTMVLHCYDSAGTRIAVPCSIAITGVPAE